MWNYADPLIPVDYSILSVTLREAAKNKSYFVAVQPLRPYPPPSSFQNPDPDVVGAAAPEHDLQTVPQAQRGLEARLTALPHSGIPRRLATLIILILLATFAPYRCMVWIWIRAFKKRDPDPT